MNALNKAKLLIFLLISSFVTVQTAFASDAPFIIVQSTTSTQNSGLLDAILPSFEEQSALTSEWLPLAPVRQSETPPMVMAMFLLVHAKSAEEKFVSDGWGVERFDVMYNDFIIVGPAGDPAKAGQTGNIIDALQAIASTNSLFASRGDDSGTHKAELRLWDLAQIDAQAASGSWYRETGSGMGATLNVGTGMRAYVLTDRATWIAFGNKADYKIVVEGDDRLFNQYGVVLVNPEKHANVKAAEGQTFIDWLTGEQGQLAIAQFRIKDQQLFFPNAAGNSGKSDSSNGS